VLFVTFCNILADLSERSPIKSNHSQVLAKDLPDAISNPTKRLAMAGLENSLCLYKFH
jgi:hypothetical protein